MADRNPKETLPDCPKWGELWNEEELKLVKDFAREYNDYIVGKRQDSLTVPPMSLAEVSKLVGRTPGAVRSKLQEEGIYLCSMYATANRMRGRGTGNSYMELCKKMYDMKAKQLVSNSELGKMLNVCKETVAGRIRNYMAASGAKPIIVIRKKYHIRDKGFSATYAAAPGSKQEPIRESVVETTVQAVNFSAMSVDELTNQCLNKLESVKRMGKTVAAVQSRIEAMTNEISDILVLLIEAAKNSETAVEKAFDSQMSAWVDKKLPQLIEAKMRNLEKERERPIRRYPVDESGFVLTAEKNLNLNNGK